MISRRTLLVGGGVGAAALVTGGLGVRHLIDDPGPDGAIPDVPVGDVTTTRVDSAARGKVVDLVTMLPPGVPAAGLPVCVVLHGRGASAAHMVELGVPAFLSVAVAGGSPPFAVAAVDGNDAYWHRKDGDDPQVMLRDELPRWLAARGFGRTGGVGRPDAVLGISMGCFGALLYDRARAGTSADPLRSVVTISPALFRDWPDAKAHHAFVDQADWEATEPLRHLQAVDGRTLAVWCGRQDPFLPAAEQLHDGVKGSSATYAAGAHTDGYWRRVLPDALAHVGRRL